MERAFEPRRVVRRIIIGRLIGCAIAVLILGAVAAVVLVSVLSVSLRH